MTEHAQSGSMVYPVLCIDDAGEECVHIFSTAEKAAEFAEHDDRRHVLWDYVLDCPERFELPMQ